MKVHHLLYKTIVIASWFCIPLIVSAQIQDLSLSMAQTRSEASIAKIHRLLR